MPPIRQFDLDVGNGRCPFAGFQGMLLEIGNFKLRHTGLDQSVDKGRDRTVAVAGDGEFSSVAQKSGPAPEDPVQTIGMKVAPSTGINVRHVVAFVVRVYRYSGR